MIKLPFYLLTVSVFLFFTACNTSSSKAEKNTEDLFVHAPLSTFDIVLAGSTPEIFDTDIVELDAFETTKARVRILHEAGKKVFAYLSVGSWEPYRPDSSDFPSEIIGKTYPGWEDEKFVNIKAIDKLAPIIRKRFDMIAAKGFDGIEADNIDSYTEDADDQNGTGFSLSLSDTKRFVDFLIAEAHNRGLSIGQKNAPELLETYGVLFDWALLEDPFYEGYAEIFHFYPRQNRAVFAISYTDRTNTAYFRQTICPRAKTLQFTAILKNRNLDKTTITCPK